MGKSILKDKSYAFAIKIVTFSQFLLAEKKECALIREAEFGQSKPDFIHKMSIALKEANETAYWLNILKDTGYLTLEKFDLLQKDVMELIAMLVSTVKTTKQSVK